MHLEKREGLMFLLNTSGKAERLVLGVAKTNEYYWEQCCEMSSTTSILLR